MLRGQLGISGCASVASYRVSTLARNPLQGRLAEPCARFQIGLQSQNPNLEVGASIPLWLGALGVGSWALNVMWGSGLGKGFEATIRLIVLDPLSLMEAMISLSSLKKDHSH